MLPHVVCTCDFVDPQLEVCEGDSVGDVEDDDDAVRVPVARRQHRAVTLLPARVPNLSVTRLRVMRVASSRNLDKAMRAYA